MSENQPNSEPNEDANRLKELEAHLSLFQPKKPSLEFDSVFPVVASTSVASPSTTTPSLVSTAALVRWSIASGLCGILLGGACVYGLMSTQNLATGSQGDTVAAESIEAMRELPTNPPAIAVEESEPLFPSTTIEPSYEKWLPVLGNNFSNNRPSHNASTLADKQVSLKSINIQLPGESANRQERDQSSVGSMRKDLMTQFH